MTKIEIRKVGVLSLGKLLAVIGLISGILMGILGFAYVSVIISQFSNPDIQASLAQGAAASGGFDVNATITALQSTRITLLWLVPLLSIIFSFLFGIIFAWVYNLSAKILWGGLKLEIDEKKVK